MKKNNHQFDCLIKYYESVQPYPLKEHEYSLYDVPAEKYFTDWVKYGSTDNLYFVMNPLNLAVKIGITNNFHSRYRNLCTATGLKLIVLCLVCMEPHIDESAKIVETHLHNFFYKKRLAGEWFKLSFCDLKNIRNFLFDKFDDIDYDTEGIKEQFKKHTIKLSHIKNL